MIPRTKFRLKTDLIFQIWWDHHSSFDGFSFRISLKTFLWFENGENFHLTKEQRRWGQWIIEWMNDSTIPRFSMIFRLVVISCKQFYQIDAIIILIPKKFELLIRFFEPFWISTVFHFSLRTFAKVEAHPGPLETSNLYPK